MTNAFDFAPLAARRACRHPRPTMDRPAEIQFRRRPQRRRRAAGRRPDRGGQCGAASARAARLRPTASPAARKAIGRCANSSPPSSKRDAGIACTADDILITSGSLQGLDLVNGVLLAPGDTVIIEQECYQGAITRLDPARRQHRRHPARQRRHAHGCARGRARRPQAPRRPAEIHLHHPDRAESDRHDSAARPAAPSCCGSRTRTACRSSRTSAIAT